MSTYSIIESGECVENDEDYNFYSEFFTNNSKLEALNSLDGIQHYFNKVAYEGNFVLQVFETDENFTKSYRDFIYDFQEKKFIAERPPREHRFLKMKVRQEMFRYVLKNVLPWEELSIGFQARFYREPDVYNFDFWNHFQNNLPKDVWK